MRHSSMYGQKWEYLSPAEGLSLAIEINRMASEKLDSKLAELEKNLVETEFKYGDIKSLEDEFQLFQLKIQDQAKLETEKKFRRLLEVSPEFNRWHVK